MTGHGMILDAAGPHITHSEYSDRYCLVDLDRFANNNGITELGNLADGGFNVWGNSYPSDELPAGDTIVKFADVPFHFPSKERQRFNNVVCVGQSITFAEGTYVSMSVLGAAERRTADTLTFVTTTGTEVPVPLCLSDWWHGARTHFSNRLALRCTRVHYPRHVQRNILPSMWVHRAVFPIIRTHTIVLPDNPALHIFALTLERSDA